MANKLWSAVQRGTYSGATAYTVGDFVTYNGSSYTCILNSTGNLPTNATYWALIASIGTTGSTGATGTAATIAVGTTTTSAPGGSASVANSGSSSAATFDFTIPRGAVGINWLGAYNGATAYVIGDGVSYSGSSYYCILASTGNLPTNTTYWSVIAAKGADGAGSGTVTSVSVTTANGVSGSVATATTTPAITITLGAITPTTVNGHTFTTGSSTFTGTAAQTYTFPTTTATLARTDAAQTFTGVQTMTSPVINTGLELGNASDTTLSRSAAGIIAVEGIRVQTTTPLIVSAASYTTDTGTSLNMDNLDQFVITAQAGALLFNAPGGTLVQGRSLVIRIKDNGTARALTWNAVFRAMGTALPSTTVLSKTLYLGFFYNSTDTKWDLVASAQEA